MTTAPIGPSGPGAAAPNPAFAGEDWDRAGNFVRPATDAPTAPPPAAAAAGKQAAGPQAGLPGLVPAVLELPGEVLGLLFGKPAAAVIGPSGPGQGMPGGNVASPATARDAGSPAAAVTSGPAVSGPSAAPAGPAERSNAMSDPIGGLPAAPSHNPALGGENWNGSGNFVLPNTGAPSAPPATSAAAPQKPAPAGETANPGGNFVQPNTGAATAPGAQPPGLLQNTVSKVLELPGDLLNALFGNQPQQTLGLSPQAYLALAAEKPWQVASRLLGAPGTIDAAGFAQIQAMPGPLAGLLQAGAEPRAALAVQERWVALNSQLEEQSGLTRLPMQQPASLAANAGDARAILGTTPRQMPPERMDTQIMALGGGPRIAPLSAEGAAPTPVPANATAIVAVPDHAPVAISREIASQIALPAPMPLGAGLTMQQDPASGAVIIGFDGAAASQVLGPLAPQVAEALAPALSQALAGIGDPPRGIDLSVNMTLGADGMPASVTVSGMLVLADGTTKPFGSPATTAAAGGPTATPQDVPATAVLHLSGGVGADGDSLFQQLGPYVEYMRPTPVPLDLATGPGADALPTDTRLWRLDDTRIFVALGSQGATEALLEAAGLHRAAVAGSLTLGDMPPGSGFETWDGSLLSLGLAGIRKTSVATAEETPPRVRALHLDNDSWRATRGGRDVTSADTGEDLRLFLAYGLDPQLAAGNGPQGGLAEQARAGFADALLQMERVRLAWWLPPGEVARRQEVWAGIAREWAATLAGLEAAGPPVLPPDMPPVDALLAMADRQGSAAAWAAFQASGLDLQDLLQAAGDRRAALSEALAGGALLAAGQLGVPADRATAGGTTVPTDLALAAAREAFLHAVVAVERGTMSRDGLEAALDAYGQAALTQLTEGEPLPHGDQGALAARLGHAAQTDIERGYLAPYLRLGRLGDATPEDDRQAQRQASA